MALRKLSRKGDKIEDCFAADIARIIPNSLTFYREDASTVAGEDIRGPVSVLIQSQQLVLRQTHTLAVLWTRSRSAAIPLDLCDIHSLSIYLLLNDTRRPVSLSCGDVNFCMKSYKSLQRPRKLWKSG